MFGAVKSKLFLIYSTKSAYFSAISKSDKSAFHTLHARDLTQKHVFLLKLNVVGKRIFGYRHFHSRIARVRDLIPKIQLASTTFGPTPKKETITSWSNPHEQIQNISFRA